jgi:serine-protein kinase ATM
VETRCLVQLSEASRKKDNPQIALNSIVRAQKLSDTPQFDVSQEYAHVLWLAKEPRPALNHLRNLVQTVNSGIHTKEAADPIVKASLYALLVCLLFLLLEAC